MTQVGGHPVPPAPTGTHSRPTALPPQAVLVVRRAFAAELAQRLPRLAAAVVADPADDPADELGGALRDAHTLASGSAVVGAVDAAVTARTIEDLLLRHAGGDLAALGGLAPLVDQLHAQLRGWRP